MKDRISHVHARTMPYVAPRRPLHPGNGTFGERSVRQSGAPYSPIQNPCMAGSDSFRTTCATTTFPQRVFKTFRSTDSSRPDWNPNSVGDGGIGQTCAQFACQNNYTDVTDNPTVAGVNVDARCCVAKPLQAWTRQADTNFYSWVQGENLRDESGTSIIPTPNEAARLLSERGANDYNPAKIHDCSYRPDGYGSEPIVGAKVYDVDPSACARGNTDTQVAKSIQSSLGLFNTPTPTPLASSSPVQSTLAQTSTPAFTSSAQYSSSEFKFATTHPGMSTAEPSKTPSVTPAVVATTASAGLLSTFVACITPTPTTAIAAASQNLTITALSAGLGAAGATLVLAGAVFAGYRIVQCCKPKNQIRPSHQLNFSRRELSQFELTDTAITNYSDPMEEPAETATLASAQDLGREVNIRAGAQRSTHVDLSTIDLNNHILCIPRRLMENPALQTPTGTLARTPTPINVNVHLSDTELNEHVAVGERIIAAPRPVLDNPFGPPLQNVSLI